MQSVIAFILVFGALVFFHELGHFLFAKRAGILVREFAIGFGPKLLSLKRGETVYTLRLLPIGGYVRMAGEDLDTVKIDPGHYAAIEQREDGKVFRIILDSESIPPNAVPLHIERADLEHRLYLEGYGEEERLVRYEVARDAIVVQNREEQVIAPYDRQFESKSLGRRTMTIFAGPFFNFLLAFFIFLGVGLFSGVPTNSPVISSVVPGGAAQQGGMKAGDLVLTVEGEPIDQWSELAAKLSGSPNRPLQLTVKRGEREVPLTITPAAAKEGGAVVGKVGVEYQSPREYNPLKAVRYGASETAHWTSEIVKMLGKLVTGQFSVDDLSGPVGIYKATEQVAQSGSLNLLYWTSLLSINLGIMNLLPIPALDGGRLVFFLFEAIRGKPVDRQKEGMIHFVGIALLMALMIVVTWNDIQRFFFQ